MCVHKCMKKLIYPTNNYRHTYYCEFLASSSWLEKAADKKTPVAKYLIQGKNAEPQATTEFTVER